MSNKITVSDVFELFRRYLFGSLAGRLMAVGLGLLVIGVPGFWDYLLYAFDALRHVPVTSPAPAFEWPQYLGLGLFLAGAVMKFNDENQKRVAQNRAEKTHFKETYHTLSDVRLQDKFEQLYCVKFAGVKSIKNLLSYQDNPNLMLALFEKGHPHLDVCGDWFKTRGQFIRLRYNVGFVLWTALPILALFALLLGALELVHPGVTQSGQYAVFAYALMFIAQVIALVFFFQDLTALGHAITLVDKYGPKMD